MASLGLNAQRHLSRIEEDFNKADKDNSGYLQLSEVISLLRRSGFKGSDDDAKKIFSVIDVDQNQKITKNEFKEALAKVPKIDFRALVLRWSFNKLDSDGSGFLTYDEIANACTNEAGLDVKGDMIADMLIALVRDEDKKINYEEFLDIWGRRATGDLLRGIFGRLDKDKSKTLSKQEILDGIKSDAELKLCGEKLANMLIAWCKDSDKNLKYEDFIKVYESSKCK